MAGGGVISMILSHHHHYSSTTNSFFKFGREVLFFFLVLDTYSLRSLLLPSFCKNLFFFFSLTFPFFNRGQGG